MKFPGLKTYYITRRKSSRSYEHLRPNELNLADNETSNSSKLLSQSASNLAVIRAIESVSPSALSTGAPSNTRHRTTTLNKLTRYLRSSVSSSGGVQTKEQTNQQKQPPPQIFVSTKSLPESLTSTNPSILNCCPNSLTPVSQHTSDRNATASDNSKMGNSLAVSPNCPSDMSNKSSTSNSRQWKLPKYLRKFDNRNNNGVKCDKDCVDSTTNDAVQNIENDQAYQLLPIIIQKTNTEISICTIDQVAMNGNGFERDPNLLDTPSCSPTPRSNSNVNTADIIDVRSYISQSRSDITPYPERSDSCKYRSHRSCYGDVTPMRRPRAKTLALTSQEHFIDKIGANDSGNELKVPNTLRKHSHHCSPSSNHLRLPEVSANQTSISQERLSTGDLCSWVSNISDDPISAEQSSTIVIPANDAIHLDPIRKQSDLQLVKCVKENAKSQQNYLVTPPISKVSLFFLSPLMEREFRTKAHQLNTRRGPITIAVPIYNTYFDILIGIIIFLTVSVAMFLLTASEHFNDTPFKWLWLFLFIVFTFLEFFALIIFTKKLFRRPSRKKSIPNPNIQNQLKTINIDIELNGVQQSTKITCMQKSVSTSISISSVSLDTIHSTSCKIKKYFEDKVIDLISTWYEWHISLGFLMSLPAILTLAHFLILNMTNDASIFGCHYGFLMLVCIVHFCNFTQLNCWMRNILAVLTALAFIFGISLHQLEWGHTWKTNQTNYTHLTLNQTFVNIDNINQNPPATTFIISFDGTKQSHDSRRKSFNDTLLYNRTYGIEFSERNKPHCFEKKIDLEIYLDLLLVLVLVWFLNREFEIFYRFAFYSSSVAEKDKVRVQSMKNQADLLLQNIIPKHVADHLKNTAKYSENHYNVAIVFASLINFNELYDESYLGGREYLRVLNELIGDFDELLSRSEFSSVEKIKTIGSTFMAASGLDNSLRKHDNDNSHINTLMEFAIAMQQVVAEFNKDLLEFDLILRIGFNVGDVTAGVIGSSKLMYDIWGDAGMTYSLLFVLVSYVLYHRMSTEKSQYFFICVVNVASRMDSTGVAGRIQTRKDCIPYLDENTYDFEARGKVFVKGKEDMEVCLVIPKKFDENT